MPQEGGKVRVLVADHYPLVRHGLRSLLEKEGGFEVVGETGNGQEALTLAARLAPDILLLDLRTSGLSGLDALRQIAASKSGVRVVLLGDSLDNGSVVEAVRLGARGVVFKESPPELVLKAIRCVLAGQYWVGRDSVSDLVRFLRDRSGALNEASATGSGLTPRERDVVAAVVDGCSNREIAERFSLSEATVKHHLTSIFDKLGISSRTELVAYALQGRLANGEGRPEPARAR